MNQIEAGCYKCHKSTPEVPRAASLGMGRDLIRIYGCFGCHRIPGYENIRKVGPDLSTVSGKLTKEWVRKWLANPKDFKSEARMPQVLVQQQQHAAANSTSATSRKSTRLPNTCLRNRNRKSCRQDAQPVMLRPAKKSSNPWDALVATPLVRSRRTPRQSQIRRRHGYNLQNHGSKVNANWVYNWVKDPRQVWPETKMPSLRLTDDEAADVAAYLTSLKNPQFESKPVPETDPATLDAIVVELLKGTVHGNRSPRQVEDDDGGPKDPVRR